MRRMKRSILSLSCLLLVLSACSGESDIINPQELIYVSALGVDFQDGEYIGYVQMLDFATIAKAEGGKPEKVITWVGEGRGSTINEALFKVYRTSQQKINWSHVTSILITEAAIKNGLGNIFDGISRYREFRLTPWVYGTRSSIRELLSLQGFFNEPSLSTILHEPTELYEQSSTLKPIRLFELMRCSFEPGQTCFVPSLKTDDKQWTENEKPIKKPAMEGAFFLKQGDYSSFVSLDKLKGLRWVTKGTNRVSVIVPEGKKEVQLVLEDPRFRIRLIAADPPRFDVEVHVKAYVLSRTTDILPAKEELERAANQVIEGELVKLQQTAVEKQTDILDLEHVLFRSNPAVWKGLPSGGLPLTESQITSIKVHTKIFNSSSLKNKMLDA